MASYRKMGKRWRVDLCINNVRKSKTLATKREALNWADRMEKVLSRTSDEVVADKTFADILSRYEKEISPSAVKRGKPSSSDGFLKTISPT